MIQEIINLFLYHVSDDMSVLNKVIKLHIRYKNHCVSVFCFQISQVDLSSPKDCLSKFKSNKWLGIILFLAIVASTWMKTGATKNEIKNKQ